MKEWILYLILNSLWIWGFHALFAKEMILERVGDWLCDRLPEWITRPVFDCPTCQSSIHGTLVYFLFVNTGLLMWPVYCVCLCGLNYLLGRFSKGITITNEPN